MRSSGRDGEYPMPPSLGAKSSGLLTDITHEEHAWAAFSQQVSINSIERALCRCEFGQAQESTNPCYSFHETELVIRGPLSVTTERLFTP
jgi:hypothetical protein